jgi:hypothetical protein
MTFRKNRLLLIQYEIACSAAAAVCTALIFIDQLGVMPYGVLCFACFTVIGPLLYNELITIDDVGITCCKKGKCLWSHSWESIVELKKSSRYLLPSVEIVSNDLGMYENSGHYFQLSRPARRALERFSHSTKSDLE